MSSRGGYHQFCPVAMSAEILCNRWTMLVIRELLCGSTRFNELKRGLPRMSPALLSKRLKELEQAGIVSRARGAGARDSGCYELTEAGRDLAPLVMAMGAWGQRWLESKLTLKNLDPTLLMWDMRRNVRPDRMPRESAVVQFLYPELGKRSRRWWLLVEDEAVDLCYVDPGKELDLCVTTDLGTMTRVWMGLASVADATRVGRMKLEGDPALKRSMSDWLGLSPFAGEAKRVA